MGSSVDVIRTSKKSINNYLSFPTESNPCTLTLDQKSYNKDQARQISYLSLSLVKQTWMKYFPKAQI